MIHSPETLTLFDLYTIDVNLPIQRDYMKQKYDIVCNNYKIK